MASHKGLLDLPAELLDMMSKHLSPAERLRLNLVSTAFYQRICSSVCPSRFFGLRINCHDRIAPPLSSRFATEMIQKLALRIKMAPGLDVRIIDYFSGCAIKRGFCIIALDYSSIESVFGPDTLQFVPLRSMKGLISFRTLRIMMMHGDPSSSSPPGHPFPYAALLEVLEPALGPTKYSRFLGSGVHYLESTPYEFNKKLRSLCRLENQIRLVSLSKKEQIFAGSVEEELQAI